MQRIRCVALIALMLFSFEALFVGLSTHALADTPSGELQLPVSTPGGEFCGGDTGFPCQTPAQPTPAQTVSAPEQPAPVTQPQRGFAYDEGLRAGKKAGAAGAAVDCPKADKQSEYCKGWDEGYKQGRQTRQQGQGQGSGGISLTEGILIGVAIIVAIIAIGAIAASAAGIGVAGAAATAAARFFGKKPSK